MKADSGHPGTPMGAAPAAYAPWQRFLRNDPADPVWPNRDRFVLSVRHAWDLFERQDEACRESVLPAAVVAPVSVEAAVARGWGRYVGRRGAIVATRSLGLSAPGKVVQAHFGFDVDHVLTAARQQPALHAAKA